MVLSLHKIKDLEDHKLLSGYIAMYLGEFDAAQNAFMESSQPLAALEVRAVSLSSRATNVTKDTNEMMH